MRVAHAGHFNSVSDSRSAAGPNEGRSTYTDAPKGLDASSFKVKFGNAAVKGSNGPPASSCMGGPKHLS